jgi:hypothetical protein
MLDWSKSKGITVRFTAPYSSAMNGRVERLHRTLMGKSIAMRLHAKLPEDLWDEMYLTAAYLHARTTTRALQGKTPYELWYQRKPDVSHLREIGCKAFVLIQNKHNPKILQRSEECVMVGYEHNSKAYRCYHRLSRKVITSYHVKFIESHQLPAQSSVIETGIMTNNAPKSQSSQVILPTHDNDDDESDDENSPDVQEPTPHDEELPHPAPIPADPIPPPEQRRSGRLAEKTNPNRDRRTQYERVMDEIRDSETRKEQEKLERKRILEEMKTAVPPVDQAAVDDPAIQELQTLMGDLRINQESSNYAQIEEIYSAISENARNLDFEDEPNTWEEAKESGDAERWRQGYLDELKSLRDRDVYELVPRTDVPAGSKVRKGRPVFTIKRDENGKAVRWKVRLVFKGFEQIYGRDYSKTSSPTARMESWRVLLHLAATLDWDTQQIDVKTAFLENTALETHPWW